MPGACNLLLPNGRAHSTLIRTLDSKQGRGTSSAISSGHNTGLHILRCNVLSTVHGMADDPQPKKIPLIFFRTITGSEPVTGMAEGTAGRRTADDRQGLVASAMALAGWNAAVPRDGKRKKELEQ